MANNDSQVEVKIVGTLDGSVSTSAAAAKAEIAGLATAAQQSSNQVKSSFQDIVNASTGVDREVKSAKDSFLAFGAAVSEEKALARTAQDLENVGQAAAGTHGSVSTATREFRALFDELSSGRTRQTPGTLAIIAQRVLGLGPAALLAVGGVAALTAGLGYLVYRAIEAADALDKAKLAADFAGNTGLNTQQLQADIEALDKFAGVSTKDAEAVVASFARMRQMSAPELQALSILVGEFAETQGVKAPEAAKIFIAALENEKLSAAELVKLIPSITQAQIANIETTQRLGNANQTAAALMTVLSSALQRTRQDYAEQQSGMFASIKSWTTYISLLNSGMTFEQIHTALLKENTDAWNKNEKAILADLDALKKLASTPPPQDIVDPITKTESAIAHLDATWKGSTAARYAAEAGLWEKTAQGNDLNAKQREDAQRRADEATFHSHQAYTTETTRLDKQQHAEALRAIEEEAVGTEKGSAEQIEAYTKLYNEAVRLDGAKSQAALSAERQLFAARAAFAEQWLTQLSDVTQETIARDNQASQDQIANIRQMYSQRQITAAQEIDLARSVEADRYSLVSGSLQTQLDLWRGYPAKLEEVNKQIEANERQHQKQMDTIARDGAQDMSAEYQRAWSPVLSGFDTMVTGILSGNETLIQVLERGAMVIAEDYIREQARELFQTQVNEQAKTAATQAGAATRTAITGSENSTFLGRLGAIIAGWLGLETAKTTGTATGAAARAAATTTEAATGIAAAKAEALAEIPAYTGIAAMGAAASVAPVPFVGPALAAAAFAQMEGMGATALGMASLDVGTNFVPTDMIAQIHEGERIIPKADNSDLMAAVTEGANDNSANGSSNGTTGGDTFHLHLTVPGGTSDPNQFGRQVARAFKQELRAGNPDLTAAMQQR